jgi:hypothetical protein
MGSGFTAGTVSVVTYVPTLARKHSIGPPAVRVAVDAFHVSAALETQGPSAA